MKFDLKSLEGLHKLTGVGFSSNYDGYTFQIDGNIYVIYEQEEDEYRSRCAIQLKNDESVNRIPEEDVVIKFLDGEIADWDYYHGILFEYFRICNSKDYSIIFDAWTDNWNDWYPYSQFEYHPENLQINKTK